jgi:hypothetical protein
MPTKRVTRSRYTAFAAQNGRCYYCSLPMWQRNSEGFRTQYNLTPGDARFLQCTAEHLRARKDGGGDSAENIAAACLRCNRGRHRRKILMEPDKYQTLVRRRMQKGRWHPARVLNALGVQARHQSTSRVRAHTAVYRNQRENGNNVIFKHGLQIELPLKPAPPASSGMAGSLPLPFRRRRERP